jgi:hypothetical protein
MKTLEDPKYLKEVSDRLAKITPDSKRLWGTMTSQEMLCHLADSCECAFGRGASTPTGNAFKQSMFKFIALRLPMKWPQGIKTRLAFDPRREGTKSTQFEADKERTFRLIKELAQVQHISSEVQHPIFGSLSTPEWKRWGYLHADHHLRQFSL